MDAPGISVWPHGPFQQVYVYAFYGSITGVHDTTVPTRRLRDVQIDMHGMAIRTKIYLYAEGWSASLREPTTGEALGADRCRHHCFLWKAYALNGGRWRARARASR
jgi:hypothetical protein